MNESAPNNGVAAEGFNDEPDYNFRGRRPGEKVILVARFHKWLLMPILYWWLAVIALVGLDVFYLGASALSSVIISALVLAAIIYSLYQWFLWNGGNYIITNQRVMRIEQISLFGRQISEAEIDRIQEISTEIRGPIHTMLGFGTVKVRTTSNSGQVDMVDVANPYDIQQEIARVQKQIAEQGRASDPNRPPRMG